MTGTIDPPCGVPAHRRGHWDDEVLGIWWCPDCGEEIWATEGVDDERDPAGAASADAAGGRAGEDSPAPGSGGRGRDPLPGLPGDADQPGHAAGASADRAPWVGWRDGVGGAHLWHLIVEAFGRERS